LAVAAVCIAVAAGPACRPSPPAPVGPALRAGDPAQRAAVIVTAGCGAANPTTGSGVAVGDGLVLTAAHVVAGSSLVRVAARPPSDGPVDLPGLEAQLEPATVVAFDRRLDLALLATGPDPDLSALSHPSPGLAEAGDRGTIVGGATSGDVPFVVTDRTTIEIDEVRGTGRARRRAYVLAAATAPGDSGAGLFDVEGRLVGLLFAESAGRDGRSWATAGDELDRFLSDRGEAEQHRCNPDRSRLEPVAAPASGPTAQPARMAPW
jgi:S1-C subfamily serine protease